MKNPNNIEQFHVPETPRPHTSCVDKAKKYNDLKAKISQDKALYKKDIKDLEENRVGLRIGYSNGFKDGQIAAFKQFVNLLDYYLG